MSTPDGNGVDFTGEAWDALYEAVDHKDFLDEDARLIYQTLRYRLKIRSFGDYLQQYIYRKAALTAPFSEVPLSEYQRIIRDAFSDNYTPKSFTPTSAKLGALSKNWLTQRTVTRQVVFLLGFGLRMSADDVNLFLTKALQEREINPKDPFEVICWYCYQKRFNYLKYEQLWKAYNQLPASPLEVERFDGSGTANLRNTMFGIQDDRGLLDYLAKLKAATAMSKLSLAAKSCFIDLYDQARDLVALRYNAGMDSRKRVFRREDITVSDLEHILCMAIPTDRHGNLTPARLSELNDQFAGKRFSRQRIGSILSGSTEVTRFDLITLNFFLFSQRLDEYPKPQVRYARFQESMDSILEKCFLGGLYVQNPYENFVLMCLLADDPLGTYADVWELSYENSELS